MNNPLDPRPIISLLLPFCDGKRGLEVNLNQLFSETLDADPSFPIADPHARARCIEDLHERSQVDFSFGGFLENRSRMFAHTYMAKDQRFIHLGVDINLPSGCEVRFPFSVEILKTFCDEDTEIGWGTRVDLAHTRLPIVIILGHLAPLIEVKAGDVLGKAGATIGTIGDPSINGGSDPHLHLQVMDRSIYESLVDTDLDGYGRVSEIGFIRTHYHEPFSSLQALALR